MKINKDINGHSDIAIIGDSHSMTSLDDKMLSDRFSKYVKNYGVGGQSMFWSMIGSRKIRLQGTKHFLIGLSNHSYNGEWKTITLNRVLRESNKVYFLELDDWIYLLKKDFIVTIILFMKTIFPNQTVKGRFFTLNKFIEESQVLVDKIDIQPINDFDDSIIHRFISENNGSFFVIFRSPKHSNYLKRYDDEYFKTKLESFNKHANCITLDFGHFYYTDSLFMDTDHLNIKGSEVFTNALCDTLFKLKVLNINKN